MRILIKEVDMAFAAENISDLLELFDDAYEGDFSEQDWYHTIGGNRFVVMLDDCIVAHAAVVPREVHINGTPLTVGYLEGVAVSTSHQGQGIGNQLVQYVTQFCSINYQLSMLSTDEFRFYEKLGWQQFRGKSGVIVDGIPSLTPEEDEGIMYLTGAATEPLEISTAYCTWREGDCW